MMNKQTIIVLATLLFSFNAFAAELYVIDDLSIYLRRGPGTQYGLTGSLTAGEKVTVLEKSEDGKYTRIKNQRNRIAWIETQYLTNKVSLKEQLPELEEKIAQLNEKVNSSDQTKQALINDYTEKLQSANDQIINLQTSNRELQKQVNAQLSEIEQLTNQVDQNRQNLMLSWFTRGGLVAGIGLLLGLVLPLIIPRRRKKDRWMN